MSYFNHPFLSNSDLKNFRKKMGMSREEPANLQAIFDFGSLFHANILEPNLVYQERVAVESTGIKFGEFNLNLMTEPTPEERELASKMKDTFFKDELCRKLIMRHDFEREKEFYNDKVQVGGMEYKGRCKVDGSSLGIKTGLELKGLSIDNEKAFKEAIDAFDYDQAVVHYMLTSGLDIFLIVGISKRKPDRLFKKIIKKYDEIYNVGEEKLKDTLRLLHSVSPEDVKFLN